MAQVSKKLIENWTVAVKWMMTQNEYRERGIADYSEPDFLRFDAVSFPIRGSYQDWPNFSNQGYTPVYIDLIDNYNQGLNGRPIIDNVSGYTLPQIERLLKNIYGLSSLSEQLKANKPIGVTDAQIDQLLSQY